MEPNKQKKISEFEKNKIKDLKNQEVPSCLYWDCDEVCDFFDQLNLPQYKETLRSNRIDGRRLIHLNASNLPKLGIQDFKHIMLITQSIRQKLTITEPYWNRSISLPPRESLELYLEKKSFSGEKSDRTNYDEFLQDTKDVKWEPPMTNQGFILPSY